MGAEQEEYIKEEQRSLKRELLRAQEEVKRIQSVPLVIGQFLEMVDGNSGIVGSTTGLPEPLAYAGRRGYHQTPQPMLSLLTGLQYVYLLPIRHQSYHSSLQYSLLEPPVAIPWNVSQRWTMFSAAGSNYYVRILSTLNRELLKPSASIALHRHSNALVDILPPEADSSISLLTQSERPDVAYTVS